MSGDATQPTRRAGLSYVDEEAVIADVQALRRGNARTGNWTLPQVCWHLTAATRARMAPGPHPETTPEQAARRALLEQVLATGMLPSGIAAPDPMQPPPDCGDAAIDEFIAVLRQFRAFTGPIAPHRVFGHMPDADIRRVNRIHCAHHLSYLVPTPARRDSLTFATVEAVIHNLHALRSGHVQAGQWSLAQAAWHVGLPLRRCLHQIPPGATSTPEQAAMKARLLDPLLAAGVMPPGVPIAPGTDPVTATTNLDEGDEVERLIADLRAMEAFPHARVSFGPFGVVTTDEFRRFNLAHAANHLSNLVPTTADRA